MTAVKRILFIVPYPLREAPSQRFRFEQYFPALRANSIEFEVQSFLTKTSWRIFYAPGNAVKKALVLVSGFWRRVAGLIGVWQFDFVFIHREAAPIGPSAFEWIIAKVFRRKIIYDFDDAIWLTDNKNEPTVNRIFRNRGKVSTICRLAHKVSCGNSYLANFAARYNDQVTINPTTIDTDRVHTTDRGINRSKGPETLTIGWTGSHSTLKYLEAIETVLRRIEQDHPNISFIVIADKPPKLSLSRLTFIPWKEDTEIADLMKIDIGVMPLPDDEWSKGKCGFKILQYMSLGIPSVSSAVGANREIVVDGENGFLCACEEDWFRYITALIGDLSLRERFSAAGRETVIKRYSVKSNTPTFLSLFA